MYALTAAFATALGIGALYASRRRLLGPRLLLIPAGWSLIAIAVVCWTRFGGVEFGPVYSVLALPLIAWVAVAANMEIRKRRESQPRVAVRQPLERGVLLRRFAVFGLAGPGAAVAATLVSAAAAMLMPWGRVDQMAFAFFLMPVLWGAVAVWVCADPKLSRSAASLLVCALAGACLVYI